MQRIITKRERVVLSFTVGIIVFSIVFNFAISPLLNTFDTVTKEIVVARARLEKYSRLLARKEYIERIYNKFSRDISTLGQSQGSLVDVLSELEKIAKDSGVRIVDIRPQNLNDVKQQKEVLVDLRTDGAMDQHLKFIYKIENSLSLLQIRRFQLLAKPGSQSLEGAFSISQPLAKE
ncbi:MAG: hypothetical protein WCI77_09840 [Candidatus Omnitrophota bacterium]